ncbi:MAG: UDP-N-acetylmuramyl-tripeptide synthetase [Firmicutes bacterium]|jgi:UDP-N-acetylmuramoyl-L-alanyl-D-glutamate--2,6-diaminopimelate ligase|nr:UDP-N-acetylmuramyl-tripeptide synthetase [Bacillota bacterium]
MVMLQSLLGDSNLRILQGDPEIDPVITGLAYHSEKVLPGTLFVCLKGFKTDGHSFLHRARERGAAAAVVERIQPQVALPQFQVENSRRALAALADSFYGRPSKKLKMIGITASNGKTTTSFMTNAILEEAHLRTGLIGTVIVKAGEKIRPAVLTTPESLDLHHFLYQMVEQNISHVTMEVSSSGLELHRVASVDFDIVVLNNISREHIDLHGSFENYLQAKASLIRRAAPEQWAIFNLDCPHSASLSRETAAHKLTYGFKNSEADCAVEELDLTTGRARFIVEIKKPGLAKKLTGGMNRFPVELSVLGLHSVYNAMAALLCGLLCGVSVPVIQRALGRFRGVERRFELIFDRDFKVIDDHFANSGNINVTLETLQYMQYRRLHLVYAIRGSRGVTVNRENAEAIAAWATQLAIKKIIATSSRSHVTEKDLVTDEESLAFCEVMDAAGIEVEFHRELPEAIGSGLSPIRSGDILLLLGCQGMDHGAAICLEAIHRRYPHLDRNEIFSTLQNRVAGT